ncbi:MAG: pantetheine-phosphate adenylyltransferase [Bacteroidota bacterium]
MKLALYPGTFDPITRGHLDVLQRALQVFDRVEVTVAVNRLKKTLFTLDERVHLALASIETLPHDLHERVNVVAFEGLLVDHAKKAGAVALIRGLRQVSDFDYEFRMALANRRLAPNLETVFLMPSEEHTFTAASIVREIHRWEGDVSSFVPEPVVAALRAKREGRSVMQVAQREG